MTDFIPGLQLSEALYREAVAPILAREFPGLVYSAARIGFGSEVLGFDTVRSTDHEWVPRLLLFLSDADATTHAPAIIERLRHTLPREIRATRPTLVRRTRRGPAFSSPRRVPQSSIRSR